MPDGFNSSPAPLTQEEVSLVARLFSDPFSIPMEFKTWLVSYLEANPPLIPTSGIAAFRSTVLSLIRTAAPIEIGQQTDYVGSVDPSTHWILCNGRAISRTTYAVLFSRCGTTYGVGDGSTTFNIPTAAGKVIYVG